MLQMDVVGVEMHRT